MLEFNNGTQGIKKVYENVGLRFGKFVTAACKKKNKSRISIMTNKPNDSVKKRRKKLRAIRKGFCDKEKEEEGGKSYVSGGY